MNNLILIGMMGCGKSTVGRLAAEKLGLAFVDTDERIERASGRTIPEIFASEGEEGFRARELDVSRALAREGGLVIACGGGGIPVLRQRGRLKGASAVIEKDYASGKMAELLDADMLMILTGQEKMSINYGTDREKQLDVVSPEEVEEYAAAGQFPRASILPKMAAGASFVSGREGRVAVIAELTKAKEALHEKAGTIIR